ncbi:hypothetical protein ACOSQ4_028380 [Xanthoceras sorbifolium]
MHPHHQRSRRRVLLIISLVFFIYPFVMEHGSCSRDGNQSSHDHLLFSYTYAHRDLSLIVNTMCLCMSN